MTLVGTRKVLGGVLLACMVWASSSFAVLPTGTVNPLIRVGDAGYVDAGSTAFGGILGEIDTFVLGHTAGLYPGGIFSPGADPTFPSITPLGGMNVRMYFYGETAGFSNQFGFVTGNFDLMAPANANSLIFDELDSTMDGLSVGGSPPEDKIGQGDYVELGSFAGGTVLDFFLIADGADPTSPLNPHKVFWIAGAMNQDGMDHGFIMHVPTTDPFNNYYLITMEDVLIPGPSVDYKDVIGIAQVAVPEPSTYLLMGSFFGLGWLAMRRRTVRRAEA